MKIQTTYQLEPGDTIYLVTETGAIKAIQLAKKHFELVSRSTRDYDKAYQYKYGMLHEIQGKYYWKSNYQEKNSRVYLASDKMKGPKARIPLYRVYDNSNYAYRKIAAERINANEYPVFAYMDRELAEAKAEKVISRTVKDDIAYEINSIIVKDANNKPIMTYNNRYINNWTDYTDIVRDNKNTSIFVKINNRTRTKAEFEAYVKRQIKKALKTTNA